MDIDKTISIHQLRSKGWGLGVHQQGYGLKEQPLYFFHMNKSKLDLLTSVIRIDEAEEIAGSVQEAAEMTASAYRLFVKIKTGPKKLKSSELLAKLTINYLLKTKTWRQHIPNSDYNLHPVFMFYGSMRDIRIRPFMFYSNDRIESPEAVFKRCKEAVEYDLTKNPGFLQF